MIKINKFKKQTDRLLVVSEKKLYKVDAAKIKVINHHHHHHLYYHHHHHHHAAKIKVFNHQHQTRHRHYEDEECDYEYADHHPRWWQSTRKTWWSKWQWAGDEGGGVGAGDRALLWYRRQPNGQCGFVIIIFFVIFIAFVFFFVFVLIIVLWHRRQPNGQCQIITRYIGQRTKWSVWLWLIITNL